MPSNLWKKRKKEDKATNKAKKQKRKKGHDDEAEDVPRAPLPMSRHAFSGILRHISYPGSLAMQIINSRKSERFLID